MLSARIADLRCFQDQRAIDEHRCYCTPDYECIYCAESRREKHLADAEALGSFESDFQDELMLRLDRIIYPAVARTWRAA